MNNNRRNKLKDAVYMLDKASGIVDSVKDEEEDSLDNMPDNLRDSERCIEMESIIDELDEIASQIETAGDSIKSLVGI